MSVYDEVYAILREHNVDAAIVDLSLPVVDAANVHVRIFDSIEDATHYMLAKHVRNTFRYLYLLKVAGIVS